MAAAHEWDAECRVTVETPDGRREVFTSPAFLLILREREGYRVRQRFVTDELPTMLAHFVANLGEGVTRAGASAADAAGLIGEVWRRALDEGLAHLGTPAREYRGKAMFLPGRR